MNYEYFDQCDGCALIFIKYNGSTFDYVNGIKGNRFFECWNKVLYLMEPGKFYAVACEVVLYRGKYRTLPFGVAYQLPNEKEAKQASFDVMREVIGGKWNGREALQILKLDCIKYLNEFLRVRCLEIINIKWQNTPHS